MPYDSSKEPVNFDQDAQSLSGRGVTITPSDGSDQETPSGSYFKYFVAATAGDVSFVPMQNADDAPLTMTLPAGATLQVRARRILAAGTTATVLGFFD